VLVNARLGRRERAELALMCVGLAAWATLLVLIPAGVALLVVRLAGPARARKEQR
jgi:hypothetical protein